MAEWLTVDDVARLLGLPLTAAGREAVRRRIRRWLADGVPAVETRPRAVGGVEYVVRGVELEWWLGLREAV